MKSLSEKSKGLPSDMPRATSTGTMFFSLSNAENNPNFSDALLLYRDVQKRLLESVPYMKALSSSIKQA